MCSAALKLVIFRRAGADPFKQRVLKRTAEPWRSRRVRLTIKALSGGLTLQRPSPLPPLPCLQTQASLDVATRRCSERPLVVLIAPDAFKGSLGSAAAARAIAAGWRRQRPQDRLDLCPLADGGDGFGPVLAQWLGAEPRSCDTVDAAGRPRRARWWLAPGPPPQAIVESAEAIGLALLPQALRHPWPPDHPALISPELTGCVGDPPELHGQGTPRHERRVAPPVDGREHGLWPHGAGSPASEQDAQRPQGAASGSPSRQRLGLDSRGLAPLLLAAQAAGAERLLLGLGGSATNDGGFGLAQALGWRFLDANGAPIACWGDLERLERLEPPQPPPPLPELVLAVDVANPLLGPQGASAVYGPQKGLTAEQRPRAEACLRRLAQCLEPLHPGVAERPGSGAAGGLGYGLQVFCGGRLRAGAELVAELCGLERRLAAADLVISGEGRFDGQSLMGKGVGSLLARARRLGRDSLVLAGQLEAEALGRAQAEAAAQGCDLEARALVPDLTDLAQASAEPALWLERLAQRAAADLGGSSAVPQP